MMRARHSFGIAIATICSVLTMSCARRPSTDTASPTVEPMVSPASAGSAQPFLALRDEQVWLSWLEVAESDLVTFRAAAFEDGAWSSPQTIATGDDILDNWADVPSILPLAAGGCAAHWAGTRPDHPHACDVRFARSSADMVWPAAFATPHADTVAVEHNFVSLLEEPAFEVSCIWLDGREYAGKEEGTPGAQTQLRVATWSDATRRFSAEIVLDPRVCDCCPTAAVRTASGALVAYRDRGDDETRDIALVRRDATGRWSAPYPLANDGWRIPGCPVNGPALAAAGDEVVAAWFTLRADTAIVRVAFSRDAGATFAPRVRVDEGTPEGRPDIARLADGSALVVWIEVNATGEAAIRARRVRPDGGLDPSFLVTATSADRTSGYPRVVVTGDAAIFAWTEAGPPTQVRIARLVLPLAWRSDRAARSG